MHRQLFVEMSNPQQDAWLRGMRERRLKSVRIYEDAQRVKRSAKEAKLKKQLEVQLTALDKALLQHNAALEKVEKIAAKVAALQIMAEAVAVGDSVQAGSEGDMTND